MIRDFLDDFHATNFLTRSPLFPLIQRLTLRISLNTRGVKIFLLPEERGGVVVVVVVSSILIKYILNRRGGSLSSRHTPNVNVQLGSVGLFRLV